MGRAIGYVLGGVRDFLQYVWKGFQLHPEVLLIAALFAALLAWDADNRRWDTCDKIQGIFHESSRGPAFSFDQASALIHRFPPLGLAIDSCDLDLLSMTW